MRLKTLIGVAAIAAALPLAANAAVITGTISDGETVDVFGAPYDFNASFVDGDVAGMYMFTFENNTSNQLAVTLARETVNQSNSLYFSGGVTSAWANGDSNFTPEKMLEAFSLQTIIAPMSSDKLTITFGDPIGVGENGPDIDFIVEAEATVIPLPASVLMLLAGLGGLGIVSRRRGPATV